MDGDTHLLAVIGDHGGTEIVGGVGTAMDPNWDLGKLLRIDLGTGDSEIVSSGLRNPQGFARDAQGTLWESEHGPRGGDELNILVPGANYGWPVVTYGTQYERRDYPGNPVQGWHEGYQKPVHVWVPSIGVSSIVFSDSEEFPLWRGDLLITGLADRILYRARIQDDRVVYVEPIAIGQRIRDMVELSDGTIALLTDDDAHVMFLSRAE